MTRTRTLATTLALFFTMPLLAQYSQNFESATALTTGCTSTTNVDRTTTDVITGTGSLNSNPPVNNSGTRDFYSPYLNIQTSPFTVSFDYKLTEKLSGQATRTIEIGLQTATGFISLHTINMNDVYDPEAPVTYTGSFPAAPTGPARLVLRMGGGNGNGNARTIIDNITANASPLYASGCNTAPLASNDSYSSPIVPVYYGASVLNNDSDHDGEQLTVPVVSTPSPDGTVTFNADGTFSFTPVTGFSGTRVTFSYIIWDNGYTQASDTAIVTINFFIESPLPVKLTGFQGALNGGRTQLDWTVTDNETGDHFDVEKSSNGSRFANIARVSVSGKSGNESYTFTEMELLKGSAQYRLRIVNKDGSVSYSRTVMLKSEERGNASGISYLQNPVRSTLSFTFMAKENGTALVNLYNMSGALLQSFRIATQQGSNAIAQPLNSSITAGTYVLEVVNGQERSTARLIK